MNNCGAPAAQIVIWSGAGRGIVRVGKACGSGDNRGNGRGKPPPLRMECRIYSFGGDGWNRNVDGNDPSVLRQINFM